MYDFTQRKFQDLPLKRQHKKCAEVLYHIYHLLVANEDLSNDWILYQQLLFWMGISLTFNQPSIKSVSDQYHWHLNQAQMSLKEHRLLPTVRTGDRMHGEDRWPIAVYLDQLRSAHNVGSIVRTMEAFAFGSLYFSPKTPFSTHKQVQNTAMGAHQWVPCFQNVELSKLPRPLIALETSEHARSLYDFMFPSSFTLVLGNEEYGCSDHTLALVDEIIEIPLRGHKNSLNVANAFAIAAGEIARQKNLSISRESYG